MSQLSTKGRNLIVCGLPQSVGGTDLQNIFSKEGTVLSTKMMIDVKTGGHRGFGFVLFENATDAARAKEKLHGTIVTGSGDDGSKTGRLHIEFAHHDAFNVATDTTHIFVRNVPPGTTNLDVVTYFTRFGEVVSSSIRFDADPAAMSVAFVQFRTVSAAKDAVWKGTGATPFADKSVPLLVKFAETNDMRAERRMRQKHATPASSDAGTSVSAQPLHASTSAVTPVVVPQAQLPFANTVPMHDPMQRFVALPPPQYHHQAMHVGPQPHHHTDPTRNYSLMDTPTGRVLLFHPTMPTMAMPTGPGPGLTASTPHTAHVGAQHRPHQSQHPSPLQLVAVQQGHHQPPPSVVFLSPPQSVGDDVPTAYARPLPDATPHRALDGSATCYTSPHI